MTATVTALTGSSRALDRALGCDGWAPVAAFLGAVAPGQVLEVVRSCLPPGTHARLEPVRTKLKPGRTLTAEYAVVLPHAGLRRRISVTWRAGSGAAPGPVRDVEDDARRRGVLAPFLRACVASDDERMSVSVAPVDGAFPQLVRWHDPRHLAGVLPGAVPARDVSVATVRYRPGQRHVLRIAAGAGGPAWFAKVYRDGTGRHAVDSAARAAAGISERYAGGPPISWGSGTYVAGDRVALWPEVRGRSLTEVLARPGPAATAAVHTAGRALRLLHDTPADGPLRSCPDAGAQAAETLRTAQVVEALLPSVGDRLREQVGRVTDRLDGLPVEPPVLTHGDYKCDNLLVDGSTLHVLDLDRCGRGDPAADVGKFLADLRWWSDGDGPSAALLHEAFLSGYGAPGGARLARARGYDALLQLRLAARRVPLDDPEWERRVGTAVDAATATLDGRSAA